ncbi:hypothetical protein C5E05_05650 [Pseudoclavibacter sp. AY1H1]|nr:hypothetical protein C5E05_05650 [Pseudoclavibacter sp. AY1H1]
MTHMAGEDTSSADLAPPPLPPLAKAAVGTGFAELEGDLLRGTLAMGVDRWFWGEGVCLLATWRAAEARGSTPPQLVLDYMGRHATRLPVLEHVNNMAPAATAAELLRASGDPGARRLVDACLAWYQDAPEATRASNGALEHWPGGVWADTVYMAGEFLLRAGRALERPELTREAVQQWLAHAEQLQDTSTGLFAHGTNQGTRIDCFWGRANAWIALAGADLLHLAGDDPAIGEVRERLAVQLQTLAALQPDHGVWDVLVDGPIETRGILETSAAAGIGAALLRGSALLEQQLPVADRPLRRAGERAVLGSLAYVDDGRLTRVSAGTVLQLIPFGYSVIRDDRVQPWGQGLALEAIAAWNETTAPSSSAPEPEEHS